MENLLHTAAIRLGSNRGRPRIYLQGRWLAAAGFAPGTGIEVRVSAGRVTIEYGTGRRVSSKRDLPVIDLENESLRRAFGPTTELVVRAAHLSLVITPARTAAKRARRCRNGREGSICSGGGLLTEAARLAGFPCSFAVELDPDYAEIHARNHPEARMFNTSISEVDVGDLPEVELLAVSTPCEPFTDVRSRDRTTGAKRDRRLPPEAHEAGDLTFWALRLVDALNPATIIVEQVPEYLRSGSSWVLRHALARMGYNVDARVMDPAEYGSLAGRPRAVIAAVTDAPIIWPSPRPCNRTFADVADPSDVIESLWFTRETKPWLFEHWDRQRARGNGFVSPIIRGDSRRLPVIKRRYFAGQGDNPVVAHPSQPGTYRWLTLDEARRIAGVPDHYDLGDAKTTAGEILGQGVIVDFFAWLIGCLTRRIATPAPPQVLATAVPSPLRQAQTELFAA